jgi:hypothetical protein
MMGLSNAVVASGDASQETHMEVTDQVVTPDLVRSLANHAALPLAAGRESAVASVLGAWLPDANALSAKMSEPGCQTLVPATVFVHPDAQDEA